MPLEDNTVPASMDLLLIPYNDLSEVSRNNSGQLFQHKNINVAELKVLQKYYEMKSKLQARVGHSFNKSILRVHSPLHQVGMYQENIIW